MDFTASREKKINCYFKPLDFPALDLKHDCGAKFFDMCVMCFFIYVEIIERFDIYEQW